jgi:hypothetical protein
MNLIQLVQRVKREAGITGATPTTTVGQVEEINRVTGWVVSAWNDLQTLHSEWEWMRHPFHFTTTAQVNSYAYSVITDDDAGSVIANFGNWKRDSLRKYLVSVGTSGEMLLPFQDYDTFRNMYLFGTMRTNYAAPAVFTVDPQKRILLGNSPDAQYYINGEFYRSAVSLANDTDSPDMPNQFHEILVWKALAHYGMYEAAAEAVSRARDEYPRWLARLEADQLPKITWGAPLA